MPLPFSSCGSAPKIDTPSIIGDRHADRARQAIIGGKLQDALVEYTSALAQYQKVDELNAVAKISNDISYILYQLGKFSESEEHALRAVKIFEAKGETANRIKALNNLASAQLNMPNKTANARQSFEMMIQLLGSEKNNSHARALIGLCQIDMLDGKSENAEQKANAAKSILESASDPAMLSTCLLTLSKICRAKGDHQTALKHATSAYTMDISRQDPVSILFDLYELALCTQKTDPALYKDLLNRALDCARAQKLDYVSKEIDAMLKEIK